MLKVLRDCKTMHRDMNPCSIIFESPESTIMKLGNFGSAKKCEDGTILTAAHTTIKDGGIYRFKAPELLYDNNPGREYGSKIDVWAGGMNMYFMATLEIPGENQVQHSLDNNLN